MDFQLSQSECVVSWQGVGDSNPGKMLESKSSALDQLGEPPTEKQDALLLSQISSLMYVFAVSILKHVTHRVVQHDVVYLIQECLGYDSSQHR